MRHFRRYRQFPSWHIGWIWCTIEYSWRSSEKARLIGCHSPPIKGTAVTNGSGGFGGDLCGREHRIRKLSISGGCQSPGRTSEQRRWLGLAARRRGANTSPWPAGTRAEIDQLDGNAYYDVLGLAGSILGQASVGQDFDPTVGEHALASSLGDLADNPARRLVVSVDEVEYSSHPSCRERILMLLDPS